MTSSPHSPQTQSICDYGWN